MTRTKNAGHQPAFCSLYPQFYGLFGAVVAGVFVLLVPKSTTGGASVPAAASNDGLPTPAIPALVAFSLLQGRTQHMIDDINETSVGVLNLIVANKDKMRIPANLPQL